MPEPVSLPGNIQGNSVSLSEYIVFCSVASSNSMRKIPSAQWFAAVYTLAGH